ncbi:hypothetical protein [Streptomyces sp. MBT53]|uniref:hypothetical protein n=1 Tax=Streptomyces sp. MBT53 TaxID=1488384 RepID=UPI001913F48B|nr:hypothetical protein [Streptomyces sp. MBT53]MBK6015157.1 hypothetical protein [Streptomyces sp. MBT53]
MTITAESFTGRVLAVFSRRSPGFRPPLKTSGLLHAPDSSATTHPAPDPDVPSARKTPQVASTQDYMGPGLADATRTWKSAPPRERLEHRSALLSVAAALERAAETLARDRDFALSLYREIGLARDRALAVDPDDDLNRASIRIRSIALSLAGLRALGRNLDLDLDLIPIVSLDRRLSRDRIYAADLALDLDLVGTRVLKPYRAVRNRAHVLNRVLTTRALNRIRDSDIANYRFIDFVLTFNHDLSRALDLAISIGRALDQFRHNRKQGFAHRHVHELARVHELVGELARDDLYNTAELIGAQRNLTDAANNFAGSDLTAVDLDGVNLAGICWDSSTRWPTPEWAARIHRASVEDPPGSGYFIVLPEEGRNFADRGSLSPIL